jgi:hypothetical protein
MIERRRVLASRRMWWAIFLSLPCTNPGLPNGTAVIGTLLPGMTFVILDETRSAR